jgi:hypothetical protein
VGSLSSSEAVTTTMARLESQSSLRGNRRHGKPKRFHFASIRLPLKTRRSGCRPKSRVRHIDGGPKRTRGPPGQTGGGIDRVENRGTTQRMSAHVTVVVRIIVPRRAWGLHQLPCLSARQRNRAQRLRGGKRRGRSTLGRSDSCVHGPTAPCALTYAGRCRQRRKLHVARNPDCRGQSSGGFTTMPSRCFPAASSTITARFQGSAGVSYASAGVFCHSGTSESR